MMIVAVQIPQIFRKYTDGAKAVELRAGTVREALEDLDRRFPGLKGQLLTPDGELHRFVNLYVNDEDVRYLGKLDTPLNNGDALSILPAVAGGSREAGGREWSGSSGLSASDGHPAALGTQRHAPEAAQPLGPGQPLGPRLVPRRDGDA